MKFKFGLLPRVVLAIALGVACGFFLPGWETRIALTFNAIFGQFLGFAIPLLILGLVAPGIADLGRNAGRLLALTAALAECGGHALLFDCGEGTQAAARRAGVNLMKLDAICLTHYHGDHIFGLPGLLQTLGCQGRTRPLALYGPAGLDAIWPALRTLTGPLPYPIRARQLDKDPVDLAAFGWPTGAQLLPIPTRHRVPSRGYALTLPRAGRFLPEKALALGVPVADWKKLQHGETVQVREWEVTPAEVLGPPRRGLKFVFSGDTAPCPALEAAAQDADLLLCDATYAEPEQEAQAKQYGHSTFGQSAALAARAGATPVPCL